MARVKGEVWDDLMSDPKFRRSQSTAEGQRRAYERQGMLGRVRGVEMTKTKPKYLPSSAPTPPRPPRKGGNNIDKSYTQSSNPAKNRPYPGTIKQFSKALEQAYERGRADGARIAGAKTTSIKGRIPRVRAVPPRLFGPLGQPIPKTRGGGGGGRGGVRGDGVGRGGAIRLGPRRGFGER